MTLGSNVTEGARRATMWDEYKRKSMALIALVGALGFAVSLSAVEPAVAEKSTASEPPVVEPAPAVKDKELPVEVSGEVEIAAPLISTLDGVQAARWSTNVTIRISNGEFRYESNGIPDHELPDSFSPGELGEQSLDNVPEFRRVDIRASLIESPIDQTITLHPVVADQPSPAPEGLIGVLINGAQLYNQPDPFSTNSLGNGQGQGFGFVDLCNGQPLDVRASGSSVYHYHAVPRCTTDAIDVEGQHSSIVGVLIDGFPVYGSNDEGGESIRLRDLDECSGHFGPTPEFPDGIYHYHLIDRVQAVPIACLSGEFEGALRVENAKGSSPDQVDLVADPRDEEDPVARIRGEVESLGER